ncbi:hypothetical protein BDZ91DRAFT_765487 [Kalaharituber pfeilii]|nr:hypothetical protein BDZ91DRAFT_765487 [Kalaharituber pfeilii]
MASPHPPPPGASCSLCARQSGILGYDPTGAPNGHGTELRLVIWQWGAAPFGIAPSASQTLRARGHTSPTPGTQLPAVRPARRGPSLADGAAASAKQEALVYRGTAARHQGSIWIFDPLCQRPVSKSPQPPSLAAGIPPLPPETISKHPFLLLAAKTA